MNDDRFSQIDPEALKQMREMLDRVAFLGNTDRADEMRVMLDSIDIQPAKIAAEQRSSHETRAQRRARERAEAKQARRKAA